MATVPMRQVDDEVAITRYLAWTSGLREKVERESGWLAGRRGRLPPLRDTQRLVSTVASRLRLVTSTPDDPRLPEWVWPGRTLAFNQPAYPAASELDVDGALMVDGLLAWLALTWTSELREGLVLEHLTGRGAREHLSHHDWTLTRNRQPVLSLFRVVAVFHPLQDAARPSTSRDRGPATSNDRVADLMRHVNRFR